MLQGILDFTCLGMTGNAWFTLVIVLSLVFAMMFTKIRLDIAFLAAMSALFVSGILDMKQAFGGFSSESVILVGVLFVVIAGLTYTGVLNWIVKNLMGTPKSLSSAIFRLMFPVGISSAFLSNTTVVALFLNVVRLWAKKLGIAPSKLLIPLSYASGMGGICTLIGTPPNIIISGMYAEDTGIRLGIFTPTICGLFCFAVGIISMIAMQKFLPNRRSPLDKAGTEDFTIELIVPSDHPLIGQTLQEIYDDNPKEFKEQKNTIIAIRHFDGEEEIASPNALIIGSDSIFLSGKISQLQKVCNKLNLSSPHLNGVLESESSKKTYGRKTIISTCLLIAMVMLSAFNILPLLSCALLTAFAMIIFRCCSVNQAMKALDWEILIAFAGSICVGKAIETTGIATIIANSLLNICGTNPTIELALLCLVATFVTEFISNTAAGAIFYPIAISMASSLGVNPLTFCVALMISVSSSFATPMGSPTHMMVYGAGGYRFVDFLKVGIPLNFIILIANIFITTIIFPL